MKNISLKDTNILILYPDMDFTSSKLVEFLNTKYGHKKTEKPFTLGDVQQYIRRGFLPRNYGFHPIERVESNEIGIKLIRVHLDRTVR